MVRYENREKVYERGARGKINWKKTMHSNPAISNGNVIYTEIISEKKSQTDNLLTEIYTPTIIPLSNVSPLLSIYSST